MSSSNPFNYFRSWMDQPMRDPVTELLTPEYAQGLKQFMAYAANQLVTIESKHMYCPCCKCRNFRVIHVSQVWMHLYGEGFMPGYKVWFMHGEDESMVNYGSCSEHYSADRLEEPTAEVDANVGTVQMVNDAFRENVHSFDGDSDRVEEPN
ncbi:unnamed protein product [Arabidopsis arenosa]|uniref:Transposase-associated domain-containing protein n=1 Tax=Arabidopsis arenosa TaxID=38785 RepID=A0A8S2A080_ARAAE|nr:unnamed protein product [Arabidopsis arenosa]